jgi:hypothetical protein
LKGAKENQLSDALSEGASKQSEGENGYTDKIDPFPSHHVTDFSNDQHATRADQQKGNGHPHDGGQFRIENHGQSREGNIRDARIHGRHEGSHGHGEQDFPFVWKTPQRFLFCKHGIV